MVEIALEGCIRYTPVEFDMTLALDSAMEAEMMCTPVGKDPGSD